MAHVTLGIFALFVAGIAGAGPRIPQPVCTYKIEFSRSVPQSQRSTFVLAVNDGVQEWKSCAPKAARFRFVTSGPADMVIHLGPEQIDGEDDVLGYCDDLEYDHVRKGTLYVITEWGHWNLIPQHNLMTPSMIKAVTMHEMGHFLGLMHNHDGVMRGFDENRLPVKPSPDEIEEVIEKE